MSGYVTVTLFFIILLTAKLSTSKVDVDSQRCTSGFMSVDRMERLLGYFSPDNVTQFLSATSIQVIIPQMKFTCDGSIQSLVFGADWFGNTVTYTELQIWRKVGENNYTKVGMSEIRIDDEESSRFYAYTLSSPLHYQAGDIVGYFQGRSSTTQLTMLYERVSSDHFVHYRATDTSDSEFDVATTGILRSRIYPLLSVETSSMSCTCGFLSIEKIQLLLGVQSNPIGSPVLTTNLVQFTSFTQITPEIKFTCDGMVTKWIVAGNLFFQAILASSQLRVASILPELQVWRNVHGNGTYTKIHSTPIYIPTKIPNLKIYEYDNIPPIPVRSGDILGAYFPTTLLSNIQPPQIFSEIESDVVNYRLVAAQLDEFTLQTAVTTHNHIMVSVIVASRSEASSSINYMETYVAHQTSVTHLTSRTVSAALAVTQTTPVHSLEHTLTSTVMVTLTSDQTKPVTKDMLFEKTYSNTGTFSPNPTTINQIDPFITVAVGMAFLGLILTLFTTATIILLWHKVKQNKRLVKNKEPPNNEDFIDNTAYGERPVLGYIPSDEHMYDYPSVSGERHNTALAKNNAYNVVSAPSHADISVSRNCAYKSPSLTDGKSDIATSANEAYLSTDGNQSLATVVSTAFFFNINRAYQESQCTNPDTATAYDNMLAE